MLPGLRGRLAASSATARLVLVLVLTSIGLTHCAPMTWNDESRMATIESLVERHTLVIDDSQFASTGDKVSIGGRFYSDKPPMPAILGAAVYAPLSLLGLRLHGGNSIAYFLVTLLTVGSFWLLGAVAFYHSLRYAGLDAERRLPAAIALGLGTTYLTWSTTFNNHEMAAGCLAIGFFFWLRARFEATPRVDVALAGLFLSLAGACDIPTGVFFAAFLACLLSHPGLRRQTAFYLLPLLVTVVPTCLIDLRLHGSLLPVQIHRAYFEYPGSPWLGSPDLSGMELHDLPAAAGYAFLTLLGPKGFLLYNPFLVPALGGMVLSLRRRDRFCREALGIAAGGLVLLGYYWGTTSNFGGWSYSIRWFVPLLPLAMFFLYPFLQEFSARRDAGFRVLLAVSVVIAFVGAINPWSPVVYSQISFVANIEQFVEHMRHPRYLR